MFGYVRPFKSELLVRQYDQYKAAYCQLCRALKQHYGWLASFTLSYDCTFYALLMLSTREAKLSLHHGRCVMNPLKRCDFLESDGEAYHKAAALSVLLTYHKLRDNLEDDSFWKSFGSRVFLPFVSRKAKRGRQGVPLPGRGGPEGHGGPAGGGTVRRRGGRLCRAHSQFAFCAVWGAFLRQDAGRGPGAVRLLSGPVGVLDGRRGRPGGRPEGGRLQPLYPPFGAFRENRAFL